MSAHHQVGKNQEIWTPVFGWQHVGDGTFTTLTDFSFDFAGYIPAAKRHFVLGIKLLDQDPKAPEGPCEVHVDGSLEQSKYRVNGRTLETATHQGRLHIQLESAEGGNETGVELRGEINNSVHIKQWPR
jgi:hypothetical protein